MAPVTDLIQPAQLRIVPANEASWEDVLAVFGTADYPVRRPRRRRPGVRKGTLLAARR